MRKVEARGRVAARVVRARRSSRDWPRRYGRALVVADAVDLHYVENWSFVQDLHILLRMVKAVVAPGATAH